MKTDTKTPVRHRKSGWRVLALCPVSLLLLLGFLCFFSAKWYVDTYGQMGFDAILYTLTASLGGLEPELLLSYLLGGCVPSLVCTGLVMLALYYPYPRQITMVLLQKLRLRLFPLRRWLSCVVCILLSLGLIWKAAEDSQLTDYLQNLSKMSTIYQDEYRDPATAEISFPEEKRNLIYIFLESMETTFFSAEQGGILDQNVIPELYTLARENTNFSQNGSVGGYYATTGATWTIGAMVAHTAGIPLRTPPNVGGNDYGADGNFLPGVTTITDVLHENGYYQALMVGSDAAFGGRKAYYTQHNIDKIYDIHTFWEDGIVEDGRYVWWGAEDLYLFDYAKQAISQLAQQEQPFAFTMLTVDTHHIGGYVCPLCGNERSEQYENVYACSSRQTAAFLQWLQAQPFYENTTVVIVGDHPSMDGDYMKRNAPEGYTRMVYNCILNPAVDTENTKNRSFCAMDMLPTTLAAMGCTIEGDRLGLGTNLFSDTPTLLEEMGLQELNRQLSQSTTYYNKHFYFAD